MTTGQDEAAFQGEGENSEMMQTGQDPVLSAPLGDLMRGERATLAKSLLDVERDLRIRASYVAAIENGDLAAFSSPGFIAGYVRSYARYLGFDADWAFRRFCEETGFAGVHGAALGGPAIRKGESRALGARLDLDNSRFLKPMAPRPFEALSSRIEPSALGALFVMVVLVLGIGYGAWILLNDFQRVQFAPVAQDPAPMTEIATLARPEAPAASAPAAASVSAVDNAALERLYRPEILQAPVMVPRDRAIATLDPTQTGVLGQAEASAPTPMASGDQPQAGVQVTQAMRDEIVLFAVRPSWVRVALADGTILFEGTLNAGDSYVLPTSDEAPLLRAGNSGSLYFAMNGETFGPAGEGTRVVSEVLLSPDALRGAYALADAALDPALPEVAQLVLEALANPAIAAGDLAQPLAAPTGQPAQ